MEASLSGYALISIKLGQSFFRFTASAIVPAGFFLSSQQINGQSFARDHWQFFIEHQHSLPKVILIQHGDRSIYSYIRISGFDAFDGLEDCGAPSFLTTLGKAKKKYEEALNAVRYSVFTSRNVFIVSKRGIRMLKGLTCSPTYASPRQVKGCKLTEPWAGA
jgi:hypothetical protein